MKGKLSDVVSEETMQKIDLLNRTLSAINNSSGMSPKQHELSDSACDKILELIKQL